MSLSQAAHAIGLRDARGISGAERLAVLETEGGELTRPQLRNMAEKYRRPLVVFYLDKPPRQGDRGQDFRTAPGAPPAEYDAILDSLIRDINARHDLILSLLQDEEAPPVEYVGSARMAQGSESVANSIIQDTGFDLEEFRRQDSVEDAFQYLRSRLESVGAFVLLIGNLGSHHTNIPLQTFRGFAIADPLAPIIVINDQDSRAAWSFTALHEAAHLWLGTSGVSSTSVEAEIERFCNGVAGRILLLPREIRILADIRKLKFEAAVETISEFARARKISYTMVAYNLWQEGLISRASWRELRDRFYQDWVDSREQRRVRQRAAEGGPSYYVVRRHRLGTALLNLVGRSVAEGALSHTKAGRVLGVKPRNVEPLLRVGQ